MFQYVNGDLTLIVGTPPPTACATVGAVAGVDVPAVIIDGAFPASVRQRIVERVNVRRAESDQRGLSVVSISEGAFGIGAACLPLLANFDRDCGVLFKKIMSAN